MTAGALSCATPNAEHDAVIKMKKVEESELLEKHLQNKSLREKKWRLIECIAIWFGYMVWICVRA